VFIVIIIIIIIIIIVYSCKICPLVKLCLWCRYLLLHAIKERGWKIRVEKIWSPLQKLWILGRHGYRWQIERHAPAAARGPVAPHVSAHVYLDMSQCLPYGCFTEFFLDCDIMCITCFRDKIKLCEWDARDYITHLISSYILLKCAYKHLHNLLCSLKLQIKDVCNIQHPKCSCLNFTAVWYIFISKLRKALVKPKASNYNAGSSRNSCSTGVCVCVRICTLNIHYVEWMSSAANKGIRFNDDWLLSFSFLDPHKIVIFVVIPT